ncbi:MAG: flagellar basal body rod protein FlgC [Planctomycetota bacterium]
MTSMNAFRALDIAGSGMNAEQRRMEVVAANIANAHTLRTEQGGPYRRQEVLFRSIMKRIGGQTDRLPEVEVSDVVSDMSDFRMVQDPGHPLADKDGYVAMPNVDMIFEMVDLMESMRAYEANVKTAKSFKSMFESALQIGR